MRRVNKGYKGYKGYKSLSERVEHLLSVYSLEELLEEMDLTPEEAIEWLVITGAARLPETEPL